MWGNRNIGCGGGGGVRAQGSGLGLRETELVVPKGFLGMPSAEHAQELSIGRSRGPFVWVLEGYIGARGRDRVKGLGFKLPTSKH